jgi:hypothetical protein
MTDQADPVIESIATEAERRNDALTAPNKARRDDLRSALAAAATGRKR